jgi:hypothetical protein
LVLMRTRKPCVRLRRRVFGWNVRLPFIVCSGSLPAWRSVVVRRSYHARRAYRGETKPQC